MQRRTRRSIISPPKKKTKHSAAAAAPKTTKITKAKARSRARSESESRSRARAKAKAKARSRSESESRSRSRSRSRSEARSGSEAITMADMLNIECPDPTVCLALEPISQSKIKRHFENFNLKYAKTKEIKKIGAASINGFVFDIPFERAGFRSHTVLKNAMEPDADNLMYEYKVGIDFINNQASIFPCFIETYMLGRYKSIDKYKKIKQAFVPDPSVTLTLTEQTEINKLLNTSMTDLIDPIDIKWAVGCKDSLRMCVLIQYFNNIITIKELSKIHELNQNMDNLPEISGCMYQIYFALSKLANVYTHYDLHGENILLYRPFPGNNYIQMHYHTETGQTISFPTPYIAKMIDYGRNYFWVSGEVNSTKAIEEVCTERNCNLRGAVCGETVGFNIIRGEKGRGDEVGNYNLDKFVADPTQPNHSHDLTLLTKFDYFLQYLNIQLPLDNSKFISNTPKDPNNPLGSKRTPDLFGFPKHPTSGLAIDPTTNKTRVHTVQDLCDHMEDNTQWTNTTKYASWTCKGDMHIFSNGDPYLFIPNV